jgi:LPPG:FO 2-phospho-L-lactate transferase
MVTFLSGGTGTPKLLAGAESVFDPAATTVVANTGDDIELGGLVVCPDLDTVLYERGAVLDRERWWAIEDDTTETHDELRALSETAGFKRGPRYLADEHQTSGRDLARWRRFSAVGEFMTIGDRDRATHLLRTSLLDEGNTLTEVMRTLADAFSLDISLLPMSDDPVATMVRTPESTMHFQEFWVGNEGEPAVKDIEFWGEERAEPTDAVLDALSDLVVIGPSNPVTSIGPMLALDGVPEALAETTVVAVSPFVGDQLFSGPAAKLMEAVGLEASTAGMAEAYPFCDAFVVDERDPTKLGKPTITTDISIENPDDSTRVARAVDDALELGQEEA